MNEIQPYQGNIATQGFSEQSITNQETVATVLAARAKAEVEARFIVAMKRPRDWDIVRRRLLDACERPGFAGSAVEKIWGAAWYLKPVGSGIEGFSIRFAEECIRQMGNLDARSTIIWEDEQNRLVSVEVIDLETNISIPTTIAINKTIERKYLKKGEVAISVRTASDGKPVYLRKATEDEVLQKQNSAISKAIRNGVLRLVPGDIQAECRERILQIRAGDMAKDPAKFKRNIIDSFRGLNVKPDDLKVYLDHDIDTCSQAELVALRDLYKTIRDGETTWHEVITAVLAERSEEPPEEDKEIPQDAVDRITEKLKGEK